jgi:hypothetical protein
MVLETLVLILLELTILTVLNYVDSLRTPLLII